MTKKKLATFEVDYLQILNEKGEIDTDLDPKLSDEDLKEMFNLMLTERILDRTALAMQREGRIGTYAESLGEEATHVGSVFPLKDTDFIFPTYREHAVLLRRNLPISGFMLTFGGDERGNKIPKEKRVMTIAIPLATQLLHAVGTAWATKLRDEKDVTLTYVGDGGSSEGDFHEALNYAGVFQTPIVFILRNNQYAISTPRSKQTRAKTFAQKAIAYGFDGIQVDGNDILAVYKATKDAIEKARGGGGPSLIECQTYRMGMHTTADDPKKYRSKEEEEEWKQKDPIDRFRIYLDAKGLWTQDWEDNLTKDAEYLVSEGVKEMESIGKVPPSQMFENVFAEMNNDLKEQLEDFK